MNSSGTRVVPTLTEVLDEQRLSKPASNLGTEAWLDSRRADEEIVPISLDWGDGTPATEAAAPTQETDALMTPWQVVEPAVPALPSDDAPFIDLSIDVAPVRAPALHEQVLEVFALPPQASVPDSVPAPVPDATLLAAPEASADADAAGEPAEAQAAQSIEWPPGPVTGAGWPAVEPAPELGLSLLPQPQADSPIEGMPSAETAVDLPVADAVTAAAAAYAPVPAAVLNMLAAANAAAAMAPATSAPTTQRPLASLDPGRDAVRQGGELVPGLSEERLQAIIQQALDRLLRDELPSALVETLIRLSPQLSESLIESLKPSLHLHVLEALSAESLAPQEGRRPG